MALARIKNPEQLKQCKPGEIGRIIGLDRIPEVRCLRDKIKLLTYQKKATIFNNLLIDQWYPEESENADFFYIDGHQRIYYGSKANLPAKFISRQKLCLSATTEFWVNDAAGMPVMMVIGQLSEKLQFAIEQMIIPQMMQTNLLIPLDNDNLPEKPQCTFVFDREAYEPAFFQRLWEKYRIAIITYRKNVKERWEDNCFKQVDTKVLDNTINMLLCEQETVLGGIRFREIRRLKESGHQTAIITNNKILNTDEIAGKMFGRWSQENFFRYLIADYDFDKMIEFGSEIIDEEKQVVNPVYRKLNHQIKKLREKKGRLEAKFYPLAEMVMDQDIDNLPRLTLKQEEYKEAIEKLNKEELKLLKKRKDCQPKIKLKEMAENKRYNKLKTESKLLMNVIKMICYRAETSVASLAAPYLSREENEKRMFIKQIIKNNADIIPDYQNKTLTVILHSLSAPRFNKAVNQLCKLLNETETIFPGTNLRMVYKTTASLNCVK